MGIIPLQRPTIMSKIHTHTDTYLDRLIWSRYDPQTCPQLSCDPIKDGYIHLEYDYTVPALQAMAR